MVKIPKIPKIPKKPPKPPKIPKKPIKPGRKTANPANAPITQAISKGTKYRAYKEMSSAEKTAWHKSMGRKNRRRTRGLSQPNKGRSFKAANLYLQGDKKEAFKIWRSIMREGRKVKPKPKPKPKPKKGK